MALFIWRTAASWSSQDCGLRSQVIRKSARRNRRRFFVGADAATAAATTAAW